MVILNYKVVREFELDGETKKLGEEIFLPERKGADLMKGGFVVQGRTLDPEDETDAKVIKEAEEAHGARYEVAQKKEEVRDEQKQDELAEDNTRRESLLAEAKELIEQIEEEDGEDHSEDLSKLERSETDAIEKEVVRMRKVVAGEDSDDEINLDQKPEDDESKGEDEAEEKPKKPASRKR